MKLGVIGDDFTGASDIANTLAREGMRTVLWPGLPGEAADPTVEAGVVALKTRTAPVASAVAEARRALDWLRAQGAEQIIYKVCSTFDSTDDGNIGPVAEALAADLGASVVPVCPAFPATGRRVFMGHLFVGDHLISETGMAQHPLTPMTDSDLRLVLARQSRGRVAWVGLEAVRGEGLRMALEAAGGLVIVDAITDDDLRRLGRAVRGLPLLTGGSGIALGLAEGLLGEEVRGRQPEPFDGETGPVAVLAGSVSEATRGQVAAHEAAGHPVRRIAPADVLDGEITDAILADWVLASQASGVPLVATSAAPDAVAAAQATHGRGAVSAALESLLAKTAATLRDRGVRRFVTAGGETSGAIVGALAPGAMRIGPEIDPGVPALHAQATGLALALKSGNFGRPDFFARAAGILGRAA